MNNKFRASWSVLSVWASGDYEKAIKGYFKLEEYKSKAMDQGKALHKLWEKEIIKNKALPLDFGGKKLINPEPEKKIVVQIEDWLELVGVIDCIDSPTIYEFKSGKTNSESYANTKQTGIYAVLATLSKIFVDRAEIHHYDQTKPIGKRHDMSMVYLTDSLLKESFNWIITMSSDMHNYLLVNKLYETYSKKI